MLDYKKAQIATTMTWAVATIIIIFLVAIFIYASVTIASTKKISSGDFDQEEIMEGGFVDLALTESAAGFFLKKPKLGPGECEDEFLLVLYGTNFDQLNKEEFCSLKTYLEEFANE